MNQVDTRFFYEPILGSHKGLTEKWHIQMAEKRMNYPLWVSSMTGGTVGAERINKNLAKACGEYGLGMGLGSCRILLEDPSHFNDFNCRPEMGSEYPLYANLGISQIDEMLRNQEEDRIEKLVENLDCDGIIIHVNLLQEWMQEEGNRILRPPIEIIEEFLQKTNISLIIKEVGQGMGPESMKALLKLPLVSLEFGAFGGTNFVKLENMRQSRRSFHSKEPYIKVGHTAEEMTRFANELLETETVIKCNNLIISGGIRNFLDGYYLIEKSNFNAVYGQASRMLENAAKGYSMLSSFVKEEIEGLMLAKAILRVK